VDSPEDQYEGEAVSEARMNYLINERKQNGRYHYWNPAIEGLTEIDDTYCRMWSTGGMCRKKRGWLVTSEKPSRLLCQMCESRRDWELRTLEKLGL
jgi:hypothetical protein